MTTLVFPGQGSQYVGMAKDFYDNFKTAQNIFELIEDCTKIKVKKIVFEDTDKLLDITKYTQICIYTVSMAIYEVFYEIFNNTSLLNINFVLGHSLGEYSALTASKSILLPDCAKLLKIRGELMQDAYPENKSGMAAVVGLDCQSLEIIIKKYSLDIEVANDNTPRQVVISGTKENLKAWNQKLLEQQRAQFRAIISTDMKKITQSVYGYHLHRNTYRPFYYAGDGPTEIQPNHDDSWMTEVIEGESSVSHYLPRLFFVQWCKWHVDQQKKLTNKYYHSVRDPTRNYDNYKGFGEFLHETFVELPESGEWSLKSDKLFLRIIFNNIGKTDSPSNGT